MQMNKLLLFAKQCFCKIIDIRCLSKYLNISILWCVFLYMYACVLS